MLGSAPQTIINMISSLLGDIPSGLRFIPVLFSGLFVFFVLHIIEHLFESIFDFFKH